MTIKEMQACAAQTLDYFIEVMPDVPFTSDDVIIELATKNKIVERYLALCDQYCPEKIINVSQKADLLNNVAANAVLGREKSFVIVRSNSKWTYENLRSILFHEFAHLFCGRTEVDGEHFIDKFGTGTTPEREMSNDEREEDGRLASGYELWSEFIAQYYSLKHTERQGYCLY